MSVSRRWFTLHKCHNNRPKFRLAAESTFLSVGVPPVSWQRNYVLVSRGPLTMRSLSYALLSSASFAALAFAAPASAQSPTPVHPDRDPCQAPADQRDPGISCPPADTNVGQAIQKGAVAAKPDDQNIVVV